MSEADSSNRPIFGHPETGITSNPQGRKPNQEVPIELGLDVPRVIRKKEDDELTIPLNSTQINPDPEKTVENPFISFEELIVIIHGQRYGYGAGAADHTQIEPGTPIRFLTPPTRSEGKTLNWFVKFGEGKTGFIWTKERSKGTNITYKKNKPPLINFIVEDIIR
jgi:hypothetical protein